MIPDIRAYDAKRLKQPAAQEHHVYFIEFEGPQLIKVGRTRDLLARMRHHETVQKCAGRYFAQMRVSSADEAKVLEAALIKEMMLHYPRKSHEWFDVPLKEVAAVIARVTARMPFEVILRGASTKMFEDPRPEAYQDEVRDIQLSRRSRHQATFWQIT